MRHANLDDARKIAEQLKLPRSEDEMKEDVHQANVYFKIDSPRSLLQTWYEELSEKVTRQ